MSPEKPVGEGGRIHIQDLRLGRSRMVLLTCTILLAPGLLLMNAAFGKGEAIPIVAAGSALLLILIMARGAILARDIELKANQLAAQGKALADSLQSREELEAELRYLAFHDQLTGLANRTLFNEQLFGAVARARRNKETMAVMLIDINGFKHVNDDLGHAAGDLVLKEVAQRLKRFLRVTDTAARIGGDEFAIVLERAMDIDQVELVAKRITEAMADPVRVGDADLLVSISIGIASAPNSSGTAETLLRNADIAMYEAKSREVPYRVWTDSMIEFPVRGRSEGAVTLDV